MQIEAGIEDVLPWPHLLEMRDRAGVDLDAAKISHEEHQGYGPCGAGDQRGVQRLGRKRHGKGRAGGAVGAEPVHLHPRNEAQELVRVGHPRPGSAKLFGLFRTALRGLRSDGRAQLQRVGRLTGRQLGHGVVPGGKVRAFARVDLVHGLPRGVEDLKAARRARDAVIAGGEGVHPMGGKDPQIDLGAEDHRRMAAGVPVGIGAGAFVHHAVVPGQRHDLAQRADGRHEDVRRGRDACCALTDLRGNEIDLGDAELRCEVAGTEASVLRERGADLRGRGFGGNGGLKSCPSHDAHLVPWDVGAGTVRRAHPAWHFLTVFVCFRIQSKCRGGSDLRPHAQARSGASQLSPDRCHTEGPCACLRSFFTA